MTTRPNRRELEQRIEELERENAELRKTGSGSSRAELTRLRIRDCAIDVLAEKGWDADLRDFTEAAGIGNSTFYRHYPGRDALVREVVEQMALEVYDESLRIQKLEDGREMMMRWAERGFAQVRRYGRLAVQVCFPEDVPDYLQDVVRNDEVLRFTGWIVNHCKEQGHCKPAPSTKAIVRTFFALVHPFRLRWCQQEGLSEEEIFEETLQVFLSCHAVPGAFDGFA